MRGQKRQGGAAHKTCDREETGFPQNHANDICALCADGHANSNLLGALNNHVGNHSVKTDSCQQPSEKAEETGKRGHQFIFHKGIVHLRLEYFELEVDSRVDVAYSLLNGRHQARQRQRRTNDNLIVRAGFLLCGRVINKWKKIFVHVVKFIVCGDSNNLVERTRLSRRLMLAESLTQGIRALKNLLNEGLVDDDHLHGRGCIPVIEVPSRKERRPHGLKISRLYIVQPGDTLIFVRSFRDDSFVPAAASKGDQHRAGGGFHTGYDSCSLYKLAFVLRVIILGNMQALKINAGNKNTILPEAGV